MQEEPPGARAPTSDTRFSPKVEIDDHKMYYGKRDLWPMLVRSGFKPSQIQLRYHKFGLNLFAAAKKADFGEHD